MTAICLLFLFALMPRYISFDEARPVGSHTAQEWPQWIESQDRQIRLRLDRGEEDTLSNLLRFGTTFTTEYRIDDEYFEKFGESTLVQAFAAHRADDLIRALAAPPTAGIVEMRAFLVKKGFLIETAAGRKRLKQYLLANLTRMHAEFLRARQQAKIDRSHMFQERGISLDSNLWPDYDLEQHLRRMLDKGMLAPGSVRRVAVVGPGLDFVNKQEGVDFYPPQTVQPFAVLDSLLRLHIAAEQIQIYTLDISSRVNLHLDRVRKEALAGNPYTVQLTWPAGGRWSPAFQTSFTQFWRGLGSQISDPVDPIPVPAAVSSLGMQTRAVKIRPAFVLKVQPVDMNIVFQRLPLRPEERFDLIIGTNVFIYYDSFQQALAWRNIQSMLKPGAYLLSNDELQYIPALTTEIPMTGAPVITDFIFCYRNDS